MTKYQAVGIGNAVVDVISQCDDAFLARMGIDKGVMQLIETERAEFLYEHDRPLAGAGRLGRQYHRGTGRAGPLDRLHRPGER